MSAAAKKVMSLASAVRVRRKLKAAGGKLVLTNGVFDLLHPGHVAYLAKARKLGGPKGKLFVALNSDASVRELKGPSRPVLPEKERAFILAHLEPVDAVVVFRRKRLDREIGALRPDIYCKAGDYTLAKLDPAERAALEKVGARIKFMPFVRGFSTTALIERLRKGR